MASQDGSAPRRHMVAHAGMSCGGQVLPLSAVLQGARLPVSGEARPQSSVAWGSGDPQAMAVSCVPSPCYAKLGPRTDSTPPTGLLQSRVRAVSTLHLKPESTSKARWTGTPSPDQDGETEACGLPRLPSVVSWSLGPHFSGVFHSPLGENLFPIHSAGGRG